MRRFMFKLFNRGFVKSPRWEYKNNGAEVRVVNYRTGEVVTGVWYENTVVEIGKRDVKILVEFYDDDTDWFLWLTNEDENLKENNFKKISRIERREKALKFRVNCADEDQYEVQDRDGNVLLTDGRWHTGRNEVGIDKRRFKTTEEAEETLQRSIWIEAFKHKKRLRCEKNSYVIPPFQHK